MTFPEKKFVIKRSRQTIKHGNRKTFSELKLNPKFNFMCIEKNFFFTLQTPHLQLLGKLDFAFTSILIAMTTVKMIASEFRSCPHLRKRKEEEAPIKYLFNSHYRTLMYILLINFVRKFRELIIMNLYLALVNHN